MTVEMRCGLWALGLGLALQSPERKAQSGVDTPTIVFVCEHGTVKSVLALAYFNRLSRERELNYRAVSRGTAPDSAIPPFVRAGLRADGVDLGAFTPMRLSEGDLTSAIRVVSFDAPAATSLVAGRVPTEAWDKLPSVTANYAVARDSIRSRVSRLVDSLVRVQRKGPR
jgi:arsenate reductase